VGPAWDEALHADRPCVLDVKTDPKVPPLPPHVTYEQAKSYAQALLKGDPEAPRLAAPANNDCWERMQPDIDSSGAPPILQRQDSG
jgi:pyruvate dehydrogenase (quinone)